MLRAYLLTAKIKDLLSKEFPTNDIEILLFHLKLISFCVTFLVQRDMIHNYQQPFFFPLLDITFLDHKHLQKFCYCDHVPSICHFPYILDEMKTVDNFKKEMMDWLSFVSLDTLQTQRRNEANGNL